MEHTKRVIKSLEIAANKNKDNFSETMVVGTKSILVITEAFRLMERRAEAAEAEVQRLNATAQPVSDGWVKCSERMPPIGKRVLIPTSGLGEAIEAVRYESNRFNRFGIEVVADYWMPLPAAPGGQDD